MSFDFLAPGQSFIDHVVVSLRALATEDFKVPDKMVGFSK